ncbi:unnamed protein product [Trichobilharzia szidati]|nr:unnamed protein product [Trichobilharzia szidati]
MFMRELFNTNPHNIAQISKTRQNFDVLRSRKSLENNNASSNSLYCNMLISNMAGRHYSQNESFSFSETPLTHHKLSDCSLRVISTQIRRIRGMCTYLSKNISCPVLYETYGRCISKGETFTNIPGMCFILQEIGHKQTVNCALYDFDEILPDIEVGSIYRCVGRYHCLKLIFQCFTVEKLNENEISLMESFQYQSNLELAELMKPNKDAQSSRKVRRTAWRPNSIANPPTPEHFVHFRHSKLPNTYVI